jgi:hypothetical protein
MSNTKTGGPAFPAGEQFECVDGWHTEPGMNLRDYFAAKVLGDVYAYVMSEAKEGSGIFQDPDWRHGIALDAYAMADAMLKAREA